MKAWLDDIRPMPKGYDVHWKNPYDAINWMTANGCPNFISFDHDLGDEYIPYRASMTGMQVVKWMIDEHFRNPSFFPVDFDFTVHSANPEGAKNIYFMLAQFFLVHKKRTVGSILRYPDWNMENEEEENRGKKE